MHSEAARRVNHKEVVYVREAGRGFGGKAKTYLHLPSNPTPTLPLKRGGSKIALEIRNFLGSRFFSPSPFLRGRLGGGFFLKAKPPTAPHGPCINQVARMQRSAIRVSTRPEFGSNECRGTPRGCPTQTHKPGTHPPDSAAKSGLPMQTKQNPQPKAPA